MLHSQSSSASTLYGSEAYVGSSNNANIPPACSGTAGRYQEQPAEMQQQQHTAAFPATAAMRYQDCKQLSSSSNSSRPQQLRAPPVRYAANSSNLAGASRAVAGGLPQYTYHRAGKGYPVEETTCTCVLPRTTVLCRLLVVMTILLVFIQAVSCGMFFCVRLPISHSRASFVDYQELVTDLSAPGLAPSQQQAGLSPAQQQQQQVIKAVPKLIPRVIHQTYRSGRLPTSAKAFMRTWPAVNGDSWQVHFYSDEAALTFVQREFPEYFEAYLNLPKDVERADFFRYMVVLRLGGAYADIDAECRQPLDSIIEPADTLLVGWDAEAANASSATATGLARQRVVANWFFVAAAGHPVLREVCDHIARNAMSTFSRNSVRDTAERTGQGVWTDLVLRHALQHQAAKHDDPWKVRILPRVAFAVRPVGDNVLRPDTPGVVVLHHFMASWQVDGHRRLMQVLAPLLPWARPPDVQQIAEPVAVSNISHYPVSVAFSPPFTFMTDLAGLGDQQAAADISAAITAHGTWQPGIAPYRKPAVVDALVGALAKHGQHRRSSSSSVPGRGPQDSTAQHTAAAAAAVAASNQGGKAAAAATAAASVTPADADAGHGGTATANPSSRSSSSSSPSEGQVRGGVLVDVGAGQGFFSLAAAARGHRVLAFEASPSSLAAFQASITYNGFQDRVTLLSTPLGATPAELCLQHAVKPGCQPEAAAAHSRIAGNGSGPSTTGPVSTNHTRGSNSSSAALLQAQQEVRLQAAAAAQARLRRHRGYPWLTDGPLYAPKHTCCAASGRRLQLLDVLRNVSDVAALRVSAHGHEGFVLQGALQYLREVHRPGVIYVEYWPAAMKAAGDGRPVELLRQLFGLGYTDIAHAGRVCDERWANATQTLHLQGSYSSAASAGLQQPTWCKLRPEQFELLANSADRTPENVMFLMGSASASPHPPDSSGGGSSGGAAGSRSAPSSSSSSRSASPHTSSGGAQSPGGVGRERGRGARDSGAAGGSTVVVGYATPAVPAAARGKSDSQAAPPPSLYLPGSSNAGNSSSIPTQQPL